MRTMVLAMVVLMLAAGCASTKDGLSWNMRQSLTRAGGDSAATAVLDEGVDKAELMVFTEGLVTLIETGTLTKSVFQTKARELSGNNAKYTSYIDGLFAVIPSDLGVDQLIPPEVKAYLLSFLRDGGLHGMTLYDESKRPISDDEAK